MDIQMYSRDTEIWNVLCEVAGEPDNSEEITFVCHPKHEPLIERDKVTFICHPKPSTERG
jgi:hypothetical protein